MKRATIIGALIISFFGSGCDQVWIGPEPANTPEANFDAFWHGFDRHYSYFSTKGVDWDSAYQTYRPRVRPGTSDEALFAILSEMGGLLRDGHFFLTSDDFSRYYSYKDNARQATIPVHPFPAFSYLENERQISPYVVYARVRGTPLGYLRIIDLDGNIEDYQVIDDVLTRLNDTEGLIVDARTTGGGDLDLAEIVASRFADQPYLYRRYKYRNGVNREDFTDWIDDVLLPAGRAAYRRPVVLLTDRRCFSACESFVLMMQALPTVTTVGDTTFGGTARAVVQELPNGWTYRVSTWFVTQPDGQVVEGNGIAPEVTEPYDGVDSRDNAMERAIKLLSEGS